MRVGSRQSDSLTYTLNCGVMLSLDLCALAWIMEECFKGSECDMTAPSSLSRSVSPEGHPELVFCGCVSCSALMVCVSSVRLGVELQDPSMS